MSKHLLVIAALMLLQCYTTQAHAGYRDFIPNGYQVPDPCTCNNIWNGVGHLNPGGGGARNQFGHDFAEANHEWTQGLCQTDSDGDGLTNGQELGDPGCVWTPGQQPASTTGLSHPGVNNDTGCD